MSISDKYPVCIYSNEKKSPTNTARYSKCNISDPFH